MTVSTGTNPENNPKMIIVIGAGGHAKVVIDILFESDFGGYIAGAIDNTPTTVGKALGKTKIIGDDSILSTLLPAEYQFIVAIGDNKVRSTLFKTWKGSGFSAMSGIHPKSTISDSVAIGEGTAIMAGAVINCDSVIGDNVIINTNATVDHDVKIGSHAHIAPGSHLAGRISVGEGAFIGTGATILPGIEIGSRAIVGAGSTVTRDVLPNRTVWGVPAKLQN